MLRSALAPMHLAGIPCRKEIFKLTIGTCKGWQCRCQRDSLSHYEIADAKAAAKAFCLLFGQQFGQVIMPESATVGGGLINHFDLLFLI